MLTFSDLIFKLQSFWASRGCIILHPYDSEKGAGTFSPHTFLRVLDPKPWSSAYVEPCRRPTDGRYAQNPNRLGHYFQFQVVIKPSPLSIQTDYLDSLRSVGIDPLYHDIRFVEDNWESPTLGAAGLGWEVWLDGMEVTQFTYFQQCGGFEMNETPVEITYGLERLAMFIQQKQSVFDLIWVVGPNGPVTYGDIYRSSEIELSIHHFESATVSEWVQWFESYERECLHLLEQGLAGPAYDFCLKASHAFNVLDARGAISVTQRMAYILRIRKLARGCAVLVRSKSESEVTP